MTRNPMKLLALLAATATAGCAPDSASLEVAGICAMTDNCTFGNTCDTVHMGSVMFNPGLGARLQFAVQLNNQLLPNNSTATSRVNSNDAHVTGYRIEYSSGGPADITLNVGNHWIPAGGSSLVWVYAANPGAPPGLYTANVYFIGYYDNGREFETPAFPIGLEVGAYTFGCNPGDVDMCPGTAAQSPYKCGTP